MPLLPKRKKRYNPTQIIGLTILALLLAVALPDIHAAPIFNNTGVYDGGTGTKVAAKGDVITVCKGGNSVDDTFKGISCDYVCKSTDVNCYAPLQTAINVAAAMPSGAGTVRIYSGVYMLANPLTQKGNTQYIGSGIDSTIIRLNVTNISNFAGTLFMFDDGGTTNYTSEIASMTIDGGCVGSSACGSGGGAINVKGYSYLHDLKILNTSSFGIYCLHQSDISIHNIFFAGYSAADRIGGGDCRRFDVKNIHFIGALSGDSNIDIVGLYDSVVQGVYDSGTGGIAQIYMEPAVNTTLRDIKIRGDIGIGSDDNYRLPSETVNNSAHVGIYNIQARQIGISSGANLTGPQTEWGDFVIDGAQTNYTWWSVAILHHLNTSIHTIIPSITIRNIRGTISPTAATVNSGSGVHNPACIITSGRAVTENLIIDGVYCNNLNPTFNASAVEIGVSGSAVDGVSVQRLSGTNLSTLLRVTAATNLKTDVWKGNITETSARYAPQTFGGVINTNGTSVAIGTQNFTQALDVASGSVNVSLSGSCIYLPGGGNICGNTTAVWFSSPDGTASARACNLGGC